jgi:hypothetical protein
MEKLCKTCNILKPVSEMVKHGNGYKSKCKLCRNEEARKNLAENPEAREKERLRGKEKYLRSKENHKTICKTYYNEHLPERKNLYLKKTYGITLEDKNIMRDSQENKCLICKKEFVDDKSAYVDHCHTTKKVRGLLCLLCNSGLGYFKDSIENMESAIHYLKLSSLSTTLVK